ncbi:S41 family peptidase [Algoriphagus sp.]|uniref:S41 family peptidase n=1 Tax=Algoriphagus sp. TaxID=1872435 RepID=UPI002717DC51|nr:S41 family peptidase [Algoriphagus sp.]MDO8968679.1 S41 family peptidase [Algoriphagus sp.]MDP3200299.1 S41 family peptidase [Algoriphagus sp.]
MKTHRKEFSITTSRKSILAGKKQWILSMLFFCIFSNSSFSQGLEKCACLSEFQFLQGYIETNFAAFNDNVNEANRGDYESFVQKIKSEISDDSIDDHCLIYLQRYLNFFKDNHTQINDPGYIFDESDEAAFQEFLRSPHFQKRERVDLDLAALEKSLATATSNEIEGIYQSSDGSYKVALVKNQNAFRDYYGIILDSKSKLWQPGQVKFELKQTGENSFKGFYYYKYYGLNTEAVIYDGRKLGSWVKKGLESTQNEAQTAINNQAKGPFDFKKIKEDVGYLSIKTFEGYLKSMFDSVLLAHQEDILSLPKLIIDVRGNGGGSDALLSGLMPLMYTDTIYTELPQLYVTEDNYRIYKEFLQEMQADSLSYGLETITNFGKLVQKFENSPSRVFVPMFDSIDDLGHERRVNLGAKSYTFTNLLGEDKNYMKTFTDTEKLPGLPQKIVLLIDRGCASTCENLILLANQNSKVITLGQNSGGYKGYGNVFPVITPMGYRLNMSTTRYEDARKYEFVGIPPQIYIEDNEDWIRRAMELLDGKED